MQMTRNQKRRRRIHQRRLWHWRKRDRKFIREAAGNGLTYMKLWHPVDKFYSFTRSRWEPLPHYKPSRFLAMLPKQDTFGDR